MDGVIMTKSEGTKNEKVPSQKEDVSASKLRKLLCVVLSYPTPKIEAITCSADGDVRFTMSRNDIGLNYDTYCFYRTEILSDFFINFWGELMVKDYIEIFAKMLTDLKDYSIVNRYEHGKFGIEVAGEKLTFTFNLSLIQRMLTEDFRKEIKKKAK